MASILKVDELRGIASAGDITITSEGGAATQSLQQGLLKHWLNLDGSGTVTISDSFNCASVTDNGTGNFDAQHTNNMNNTSYSGAGSTTAGSGAYSVVAVQSLATGTYRIFVSDGGSGQEDTDPVMTHVSGDLA